MNKLTVRYFARALGGVNAVRVRGGVAVVGEYLLEMLGFAKDSSRNAYKGSSQESSSRNYRHHDTDSRGNSRNYDKNISSYRQR